MPHPRQDTGHERASEDHPPRSFRAFVIHAADNVATLIDDAPAGTEIACLGAGARPGALVSRAAVARGHKIALCRIDAGAPVVKFGATIGHATVAIERGNWVHLHNLASDLDARSASLDLQSGAPTDTGSAYV